MTATVTTTATPWTNEAKWIWTLNYDDTIPDGQIVYFRRIFTLSSTIPNGPCHIHVSADTRYRLFVNGKSVSFGPCKSYLGRWYYETVDVSSYLKIGGENVIFAKVLRFSGGHAGSFSLDRGPYPGFILYCRVDDQNLHTGLPGWEARPEPAIQFIPRSEWNYAFGPPFMVMNERVNADLMEGEPELGGSSTNTTTTTATSIKWEPAVVKSVKSMMLPVLEPWKLVPRPIPQLPEITKRLDGIVRIEGMLKSDWSNFLHGMPVTIPPNQSVLVEFESDVLTTGFLCLDFVAHSKAEIRIMCSEAYEDPMPRSGPGTPRHKADRTDHVNGKLYGPSDYYSSRVGNNMFEPFWFRAFRYVQLEITTSEQTVEFRSLTYRETHYHLDIKTKVALSTELDKMWEISLNTLRNCMHETYEDCPYYEQNQFIMDSRLQMLLTYQLSTDDRLARKTIHEFYASRRDDGLLEAQFPCSTRSINIPQFSLFWIFMIHDHMRYFGDRSLIKRYIGTIDGILDHFDNLINEQGLVGQFDPEMWPFVDWVKEWHGTTGLQSMGIPQAYGSGAATYNSLVYAFALLHAADLCNYIGRGDTAEEYCSRAEAVNDAVNTYCFDGEMYVDGPNSLERSQHSQIFAILSGAISGQDAAVLMRKTIANDIPQCSYAMSFYVLRAADIAGVYMNLFPQLMNPWREMMKQNLTTWAEDNVMFRSDCHGWSSTPVNEIVTRLFGVSPAAAGYAKVQIKPYLSLLPAKATGTFVNIHGQFNLSWDVDVGLSIIAAYDMNIILILDKVRCVCKAMKGIPLDLSEVGRLSTKVKPGLIDLS